MPGRLMVSKYESLKIRVMASEALRLLKRMYPYSLLSKMTGIPESVLSRYVTGHTVPSLDQAKRILDHVEKIVSLRRAIIERLNSLQGLVDLSPILGDPLMLRLIGMYFYRKFQDKNVTKILVPETSGIPIATTLSLVFEVPMVVARRRPSNPFEDYVCEKFVEPPSSYIVFYVPRGTFTRRDRVLVVDDIVQTGRTLHVMKKIVENVGAILVGVAAMVVVGEEWKKRSGINDIEALVYIRKPSGFEWQ